MGLFNKSQKITSEGIYENSIKPNLHEKDGNIHVCLVTSFSKFGNQGMSNAATQFHTLIEYK